MNEDTIVAIATPPGFGGVGILRISGHQALPIAKKIAKKKELKPRYAHFCCFYDKNNELIDEGLILYFPNPHSFTGEDVIELQTHGSPIVLDKLLSLACSYGATHARPGQFSERAFLNDKLDLTQAEAIADLIHASSEHAAKMAVRSLQGDFSKRVNALSEQIIYLRLYVEAAIDFPEEEIDFLADGKVQNLLHELQNQLNALLLSTTQGAIIREGLSVVIAGKPNAGKSTLMNALSGDDVAIVTDVAGTTRDVMKAMVVLDDVPMLLIDTAGLHESDDPIEQEGIRRALDEVSRADCVLLLIDSHRHKDADEKLDFEIKNLLPTGVPVLKVYNKIDQLSDVQQKSQDDIYISAKSGQGIDLLIKKIAQSVGYQPSEGHFIARRRHLDALNQAKKLLDTGAQQLHLHQAGELLAEDLRQAHLALCEITGEFTSDDLLGEIFSSFCIGK